MAAQHKAEDMQLSSTKCSFLGWNSKFFSIVERAIANTQGTESDFAKAYRRLAGWCKGTKKRHWVISWRDDPAVFLERELDLQIDSAAIGLRAEESAAGTAALSAGKSKRLPERRVSGEGLGAEYAHRRSEVFAIKDVAAGNTER
jgi:hypothetical protein